MPTKINDQSIMNFMVNQTAYIEREVVREVLPEITYPRLVPVDASAPEWIKTVTHMSSSIYGKAEWVNLNADDIPMAGSQRAQHEAPVFGAAIGYGYGLEEIHQAMMLDRPLTTDDAFAARRAYEEFMQGIALYGDPHKGLSGLLNNSAVGIVAATQDWDTAPVDIILGDINSLLTTAYMGSKWTATADTLLLPITILNTLGSRRVDQQGTETVLSYIRKNNVRTIMRQGDLDIFGDPALETASASGGRRAMTYTRRPDVLKLHVPMPHRFLPVHKPAPLRFEVPGIFRTGGVDIRRPDMVSYLDGI